MGKKTIIKGNGMWNLPTRIRFRSKGPRIGGVLGVELRRREEREDEDEMVGSLAYGFSGARRPIVGMGALSRGWWWWLRTQGGNKEVFKCLIC